MSKERYSCICLTCGVRNDHTHPDGLCQNGHDDWLEYHDVKKKNATFQLACNLSGMTPGDLAKYFMSSSVRYIHMTRRIHDEAEIIEAGDEPFDWRKIEKNDWEYNYRMLRCASECICPMCKKTYKEHPLDDIWGLESDHRQLCNGILAKL